MGPFVIMLKQIITLDAWPFAVIFGVFMCAFSTCFWLLDDDFDNSDDKKRSTTHLGYLAKCMSAIFGENDFGVCSFFPFDKFIKLES